MSIDAFFWAMIGIIALVLIVTVAMTFIGYRQGIRRSDEKHKRWMAEERVKMAKGANDVENEVARMSAADVSQRLREDWTKR